MEFSLEKLRNRKSANQGGFTLIEMAIVLVIIGLIIGAVLKGQDLMDNARAKRFANFMRQAEVAVWTHMDRMGYFPGDDPSADGNGPDGDLDEGNSDFYDDIENDANIEDFDRDLSLGSATFEVGVDMAATDAGVAAPVLCIAKSDGSNWTDQERVYAQMFDTSIDDTADAIDGKVFASTNCGGGVPGDGVATCGANPAGNISWAAIGTVEGVCYFFDAGEL